jgi:hypothetical protein
LICEEELAIPAGLEPACRLIRNQVLVRLSYGTMVLPAGMVGPKMESPGAELR